ncbi:MAG TPA: LacI family transcriptional regulator [Clostridiaceae bacterium]|jgi:LacI family transcriptional regulator|nr:LacI family transcriptional regulator [Clostridiaceae bacterium]
MSVTTGEIAKICGVSRGTVDRALHGRPGISPETRKKIIETAQKLGYRTNFVARSLVKGETKTLGVVAFDLYNRFFAQMVNAIEFRARELGYFIYLTLTNKDAEIEKKCIEHLVDRRVDGMLLCSVNNSYDYDKYLKSLNIPIVTIINKISESFYYVSIDDRLAMEQATKHVISKDYERIIYLSPALEYKARMNIYAVNQRLTGFTDAIHKHHSDIETIIINNKNFNNLFDKIKFTDSKKTAVIGTSDIYALEVLNYFKKKGIRVPDDAGIMGFDNIDILKYIEPALATISYPMDDIGIKALDLLLRLIRGEDVNVVPVLEHRIVNGMSL